jgi:hypothetical protein
MTADLIYGPQTEAVLVLIEQARALTDAEIVALAEAWDTWDIGAVGDAANVAVAAAEADGIGTLTRAYDAWSAAWAAADAGAECSSVWGVAWAAGDAAGAAAMGLAVRHLVDDDTYRTLTRLWALVHPDDSTEVHHD